MTRSVFRLASLAVLCAMTMSAPVAATTRTLASLLPPPTSAPANVSAVSGNARVTVSWSPVEGATGYRVFRGSNGVWGIAPVATTKGTTHTSHNLINGTTYSFTVAAYTNGGNGPLSPAVIATPLAPPAGVTAASGDQRVTLNWQPSVGATSYTIYRRFGGDVAYSPLVTGVMAPPFVDPGLTNGTRYYYQLRAFTADAQSGLSASVSAVPLPPPPAAESSRISPILHRSILNPFKGGRPPSSLVAVQL